MFGAVYFSKNETAAEGVGRFILNSTVNGLLATQVAALGVVQVHPMSAGIYGGLVAVVDQIFEKAFQVSIKPPMEKIVFGFTARCLSLISSVKIGMSVSAAMHLSLIGVITPLAISLIFSVGFLIYKKLSADPTPERTPPLNSVYKWYSYQGVLNSFYYKEGYKIKDVTMECIGGGVEVHTLRYYKKEITTEHSISLSSSTVNVATEQLHTTPRGRRYSTFQLQHQYARWALWEKVQWCFKTYYDSFKSDGEASNPEFREEVSPHFRWGVHLETGGGICDFLSDMVTVAPKLFLRSSGST